MQTQHDTLQPWRKKLESVRNLGAPRLIPSSRRFVKDRRHAYGWEISFRQTVKWPDGKRASVYFSDIGVNRTAAIGNSLRRFNADDMSLHHPDARAIYQAAKATQA